jgi:hypothetical protein
MDTVFSILEKAIKNSGRHYGDVKLSEFGCGCKILATLDEPKYTVFREICGFHRKECEEIVGRENLEKLLLKDDGM